MTKIKLGPQTLLYPMPAVLVGANINNKPNFMTAAWAGIVNGEPPMISVAIRSVRHTLKGIKQNNTFSVNIPSINLVKETDYCGLYSGDKVDKVKTCAFTIFYGSQETAPMIQQCPVNLECSVINITKNGSHELVIGKIEETYISDDCLTGGKVDVSKVMPLIFASGSSFNYYELGRIIGPAFKAGKDLASG
ncbi:MAG TPA: flavin reductase family protein [Dehalococcoidia bacterium]|nr:flavin reductase family protein [Dehalococcoidia bacterium]